LFATFEVRPIAAASLAQVHRATLPDGRRVAVKVQYPDVADLTRLDILNLQRLVRLVARLEKNFDYTAIANELATQIPMELDFEREARMTETVRLNLAGEPNIVVPRVIEGYVARKVLVTEYLDGARLLDAEERAKHYEDPLAMARAIAAIFGHQMLIDGVFQADPHPGNLLALPGNRVGIVDFGLTKELPDSYRLGFARFVMGAHQRNPLLLARGFAEMGIVMRGDNQQEARMRMADLMLVAERPDNIGDLDRQRRSAVRYNPIEAIPSDLILIGRVMALLRGVSASLGVVLDPMEMLAPYAQRAIATDEAGLAEAAS
jgi:predicted unusual protein kinase regulating ubiquinone biosynthesis (AarF/ABC1/UbiB family)